MKDIVCFEVDNWIAGKDYPAEEPFLAWMGNDLQLKFMDEKWCKENKLCVKITNIDMSVCFLVTCKREWIEKNCPCLFTDNNSKFIVTYPYPYVNEWRLNKGSELADRLKAKFENMKPEILKDYKPSELQGRISRLSFLDYEEKNFGAVWFDGETDTEYKD